MNIFKKIAALLQLREAVRKAEEAHAATGQRYYVMPAWGPEGKLVVMDRKNFRKLKRKHYIHHEATVRNLMAECFYVTPDRSGRRLSESDRRRKAAEFFKWKSQVHKRR